MISLVIIFFSTYKVGKQIKDGGNTICYIWQKNKQYKK